MAKGTRVWKSGIAARHAAWRVSTQLRNKPGVTFTSECTQSGLLSSEPSSTLSLPFHPPPYSTSRGEVCNVFDLMHSRNKVYCRVACVASWIHFSWASAPPHVRVFARAPLCAHRKTWLGLMKRARWLPPLFLSLSLSTLFRSSCHGNRESSLLDLHRNRRRPVTRSLTRLSLNSRDRSRDAWQFIARRGSLPRVTITQGESNGWTCYRTMVEGCK